MPLPELSVLWRGPASPGDSMGNVTFDSLAAVEPLLKGKLFFWPFENWRAPAPMDPGTDPRWSAIQKLRCGSFVQADLEIQMPGLVESQSLRCVRFLFHEFGNFPKIPLGGRDVFWVPSRFIEEKVQKAFPDRRTIVSPHGFDPQVFRPEGERLPELAEEKFRFLYVGTTISRKGIDLVLEAFRRERKNFPQAELVLKVFPTTSGFVWEEIYRQEGVVVIDRVLTPREMAACYRSCNLLVAPSRAEAFCMPVLEAMACGLACAVPNGCAMDDFCDPAVRYSIESETVRISAAREELSFLEPELESLGGILCDVFQNPEESRKRGQRAHRSVQSLTWKAVTTLAIREGWKAFS